MKRLKKIAIILITVTFICFAIGYAIKSQIRLVKSHDRTIQPCVVDNYIDSTRLYTIEDVAEYAKKTTSANLTFGWHNEIYNGKANCVGYAQLAAVICNELFKRNNIKAKAKPVVGCYYYSNTNIHNLTTKFIDNQRIINFIKDHDYVEIVDSESNVVYSFDPSIYDLTWLDFEE